MTDATDLAVRFLVAQGRKGTESGLGSTSIVYAGTFPAEDCFERKIWRNYERLTWVALRHEESASWVLLQRRSTNVVRTLNALC